MTEEERGHFIYFALPLGAKRALDYAKFFEPYEQRLSNLKYRQAELFGGAHTYAVEENRFLFAGELEKLAKVEEDFKMALLSI